ncbi:MAG: ribonuclease PH [Candidatus Babeliaceae bacterium]
MHTSSLATSLRAHNRLFEQLRPLKATYDVFSYAAGSVLFEMGNTKVLCAVTLQAGVPHFLRGKKEGWLTAEYSLLPAATPLRTVREITINKRSGRTIEISRLIGRALRSIIKFDVLGEYTIFIDCDVLQADGGTRTACVTGAYLALRQAQARWQQEGVIAVPLLIDELAAVSVGFHKNEQLLLDVDFAEDSELAADFNFIVTRSNKIVEIQGTAEKAPLSCEVFTQMQQLAFKGTQEIFVFFDKIQAHAQPSDFSSFSPFLTSDIVPPFSEF